MSQLSIFDFVSDGYKVENHILDIIQSLFKDWEVYGYVNTWGWTKSKDYSVIIERNGQYKWVHVEIYSNGKARIGYGERTDFEPHWIEWYEQKKRFWKWKSLKHRNKVLDVARKNQL